MHALGALVVFALVGSGTPGPSNTLLWASGLQFGFRATVPQVAGSALGVGSVVAASAAGIGVVVAAVPQMELTLQLAGSAYLLYLAYRLAGSSGFHGATIARPLRLHEALLFQWINPKAWLFALAAVSAFRPTGIPVAVGSGLVVATVIPVVLVTASVWAAGGTLLQGLAADERRGRAVNVVLAAVLAASIVFIWL
jgi:threonine/homoserine/homoserine lactone efflux protein